MFLGGNGSGSGADAAPYFESLINFARRKILIRMVNM